MEKGTHQLHQNLCNDQGRNKPQGYFCSSKYYVFHTNIEKSESKPKTLTHTGNARTPPYPSSCTAPCWGSPPTRTPSSIFVPKDWRLVDGQSETRAVHAHVNNVHTKHTNTPVSISYVFEAVPVAAGGHCRQSHRFVSVELVTSGPDIEARGDGGGEGLPKSNLGNPESTTSDRRSET